MECRWGSRWFVGMPDDSPPRSLEFRSANTRSVCWRKGTLLILVPFPFRGDSKRPGVNLPWKARGTQEDRGSRLAPDWVPTPTTHFCCLIQTSRHNEKRAQLKGDSAKVSQDKGRDPHPWPALSGRHRDINQKAWSLMPDSLGIRFRLVTLGKSLPFRASASPFLRWG